MKIRIIILTFLAIICCHTKAANDENCTLKRLSGPDCHLRDTCQVTTSRLIEKDTVIKEALNQRLKTIHANYNRINQIATWTSVERKTLNQSTEGGTAVFYHLKDTLVKVDAIYCGQTGKHIQEFYLQGGQLILVLEKYYGYHRPLIGDKTAKRGNTDTIPFDIEKAAIMEERSFFENGDLISQINNQDCGAPFAKDYLKKEDTRLKSDFGKLKGRLKN